MNTIFTRRSVRNYITDKVVEKEKMEMLLKAGMQAPSARNQQPWEFILVDDTKLIREVKTALGEQKMLDMVNNAIVLLEKTDVPRACYIEQDVGACMQNILLQAAEMGLGTCWMGCEKGTKQETEMRRIFDIPSDINIFGFIVVGYPSDEGANKFVDRYDEKRVSLNKYSR